MLIVYAYFINSGRVMASSYELMQVSYLYTYNDNKNIVHIRES